MLNWKLMPAAAFKIKAILTWLNTFNPINLNGKIKTHAENHP